MGTQATHIDKLSHAWPSYVSYWRQEGVELEGKMIWMHGGAWTVYPSLLAYLVTGKGGILTTWEAAADKQYTSKSLDFIQNQSFGDFTIPEERLRLVTSLQELSTEQILSRINAQTFQSSRVEPELESESVDLAVTGGILEHFTRRELAVYLQNTHRILRKGGWASHVFDLRDHLYHADKSIPFLHHLKYTDREYQFRFGHPLGFHNRMLPHEIEAAFLASGFEVISVRRRILPKNDWVDSEGEFENALVGLDRRFLAPQFAAATQEDLRTVAIQYLTRKLD